MTQQNMPRIVIIDERFSKSLTLALNFTFVMISHSATFQLTILNAFFLC